MKTKKGITLDAVREVYSGPEMQLWELLMGRQIHLGGAESTDELIAKANLAKSSSGVDLCCCTGEGMRYLVEYHGIEKMTGVDATLNVIELGRCRTGQAGLTDRISFVHADATDTKLPDGSVDFVWGEDAWCYVDDKPALIAEAVRLVRPGGTVAFSDWMENKNLSDAEAQRFLGFMKFANILKLDEYVELLENNGCDVISAGNTGRFAACVELYLKMLRGQHRYDALKILGNNTDMLNAVIGEMEFIHGLANSGKIMQGMVVARKKD
jgi:SAM-dependent methyltransferase